MCMGTEQRIMKGTLMKAPPAPTSPEMKPRPVPAPYSPSGPGRARVAVGWLLLRSMRSAM